MNEIITKYYDYYPITSIMLAASIPLVLYRIFCRECLTANEARAATLDKSHFYVEDLFCIIV